MGALRPTHNCNVELTTVYSVSKLLGASLDLTRSLRDVVNILSSFMGLRRCTVCLVEEGGKVRVVAGSGVSAADALRGRFTIDEKVLRHIIKSEIPVAVPDVAKEPLFSKRTGDPAPFLGEVIAFAGVPIKSMGRTIGVLAADRPVDPGQAQDFHIILRVLSMVANLIGQTIALHNKVAEERDFLMRKRYPAEKPVGGGTPAIADLVATSPSMRALLGELRMVAPSASTVLLRGESGTGKEMVARAVHKLSPRAGGPFIMVNCAALPETLLESELFGHEKGSFTGATQARRGRFEMAHEGTLFLDEIGDISPAFQAKLLRVLQEREFERVGGTRTIKVDTRLICATNRNLEEAVGKGEFRADLYYRINVIVLFLPPLRERPEDIPALARHFLRRMAPGRKLELSDQAMATLARCPWPGNVRELQNCIERQVATASGEVIDMADLACSRNKCFSSVLWEYRQLGRNASTPMAGPAPRPPLAGPVASPGEDAGLDAGGSGRERLLAAMEKSGWVQAKAARLLGLTPRQIGYALRKHGISLRKL